MANQTDDPAGASPSNAPEKEMKELGKAHEDVMAEAGETEEEDVAVNRFSRVIAVFSSPSAAMRGVKLNGGWMYPLLVFIICTILYVGLAGPYLAEVQIDRQQEQMQKRVESGQMTQDQADQTMEMSSRFQSGMTGELFMAIGTVFVVFIVTLISASLLILIGNIIHHGHESFGKYWSLVWYVGVIGSAHLVIMAILIRVTQDPHGGYLGLAILTKSNPFSAMHQAATTINIFSIWEAVVAGIGLSLFAKIGQGLGMVWGLIIFVILPAAITYSMTAAFAGMG